jgi:hypothetical protein
VSDAVPEVWVVRMTGAAPAPGPQPPRWYLNPYEAQRLVRPYFARRRSMAATAVG